MMRRRDGSLFPGARHERRFSTTELLGTEQRIIDTPPPASAPDVGPHPAVWSKPGCDVTGT